MRFIYVYLVVFITMIGCRSKIEKVIERQYRGGIREDSVISGLYLGMHMSEYDGDRITEKLLKDHSLYITPKFSSDSLLLSCLLEDKDSLLSSPMRLLDLFDIPGEDVLISSQALDSQYIQVDGNKLISIRKNSMNKWVVFISDLWSNPDNFKSFKPLQANEKSIR